MNSSKPKRGEPGYVSPLKGRKGLRDPALIRKMIEASRLVTTRPLADRFWEKVEKRGPDECWMWKGSVTKTYGNIWANGRTMKAHQVAWMLAGNEVPDRAKTGLELDHTCKVRLCVNPAHLRVLTHRENSTVNSDSPMAENARKTHCRRGHPLTDDNIAIIKRQGYKSPLGWKVGRTTCRTCLTCFPTYWRHALIPRPRPPGSRIKPGDPDYRPRGESCSRNSNAD